MAFFNFFKKLFKQKKKQSKKKFRKRIKKTLKKRVVRSKRRVKRKTPRKVSRKKIIKRPKKKIKKSSRPKHKKKISKKFGARPKALKEKEIGIITHYFDKISVGIIKLKGPVSVGEHLHIKGSKGDFTQVIGSMQYNHKDIILADKGLEIGIKVNQPVHENDLVYKII
jgi:hypothetical protein